MDLTRRAPVSVAIFFTVVSGVANAFDPYFWIPDSDKSYSTKDILKKFYRPALMLTSEALPVAECLSEKRPQSEDIHPYLFALRTDIKRGHDITLNAFNGGIGYWSGDSDGYMMAKDDLDAAQEMQRDLKNLFRDGERLGCQRKEVKRVKWKVNDKKKKTQKALKQYFKAKKQVDELVILSECELKTQGEVMHDRKALLKLQDRISVGYEAAKEAVEQEKKVWYAGTDHFSRYLSDAELWKNSIPMFADIYVERSASKCLYSM